MIQLTGTLSLREEDKERHQAIYATQLYGTFYGVFAKFECEYLNDSARIKKIHFIGINYKGPSTLKICRESPGSDKIKCDTAPSWSINNGKKSLNFQLWVQASCDPPSSKLEKSYLDFADFEDDYIIKNNEYIHLDRMIFPMNNDHNAPLRERAFVMGHFDEEFYQRDGLMVLEREDPNEDRYPTGDIIVDDDIDMDLLKGNEESEEARVDFPTIKCTPSVSRVII